MRTLSMISFRCAAVCALAACSGVIAGPVLARDQTPTEGRSEIVWFSDLNLSHPQGVAELYRRIGAAARRLCADRNTTVRYWSREEGRCVRETVAKAVDAIGSEQLSALHREKMGHQVG
jgi:UrcA family protein